MPNQRHTAACLTLTVTPLAIRISGVVFPNAPGATTPSHWVKAETHDLSSLPTQHGYKPACAEGQNQPKGANSFQCKADSVHVGWGPRKRGTGAHEKRQEKRREEKRANLEEDGRPAVLASGYSSEWPRSTSQLHLGRCNWGWGKKCMT